MMLILEGTMTTLIQVFKLEDEEESIYGYLLIVLLCTFSFIYSGTW